MKMISFRETLSDIKSDLPRKNLISFLRSYFYNPSFRVLLNYRLGRFLTQKKSPFVKNVVKYFKYRMITKRNCDISYRANIGRGVKFPHPLGIVIGEGVIIKNNVKIWQNVTMGSHGKRGEDLAYPLVEEDVKIFTGSIIIGDVQIGKRAIIGAHTLVNKNIPKDSTATGIPCKIFKKDED